MYPSTLLARAWPDPSDPTLPSPSIELPSYSSRSLTTHCDPFQSPPRPLREPILVPPDGLRASDPADLVDRDLSLLSCGICLTSFGFRSPAVRIPIPILSGKQAEIPQAAIPIGWMTATPAHPEVKSPFSLSSHLFLVLFAHDAPRPSRHVLSHTFYWPACCPSGRIGRGSRRFYGSPNGFSLPPRVVGLPVSTFLLYLSPAGQ